MWLALKIGGHFTAMVKVLFLLAPGFEPIEAITPIDLLRRAGAEVTLAAVGTPDLLVAAAHKVTVKADVKFDDVATQLFDAIVAPGGMPGTTNLAGTPAVVTAIRAHNSAGKLVGAICAAPGFVLGSAAQILGGKNAAGYPGADKGITESGGTIVVQPVVIDGNIITSRGPGTALPFGLALVKALFGAAKEQEIGKAVLVD
jgi:4-methyl-5(b-hydroxyethyl)-thiazole monophosphate biosynthesis